MTTFLKYLDREPVIIAEGAVIERLRRTAGITLDPHILNSSLLYYEEGMKHLTSIYRQYIECAHRQMLPMIVLTPTWRANPERISRAGLEHRDVNGDCYRFLRDIRAGYDQYAEKIFIGGLMGCHGDAYKSAEALPSGTARFFHREQAGKLASAGVDFLLGSTLPALSEALGMAEAMAETGCPYILSFVLRAEGIILDGTLLSDAVNKIDAAVSPGPAGYMVNCIHPENFRKAITGQSRLSAEVPRSGTPAEGHGQELIRKRVIGLQANTSRRTPEELDGREELDTEDPVTFGEMMASLHKDFSLKILGGCCGTNEQHIDSIIRSLTSNSGRT